MKTFYYTLIMMFFSYGMVWAQPTSYGNLNEGNAGNGGNTSNVYFGYEAGLSNTAAYNTFLGYRSGYNNLTGERNTFLGYASGLNNTASYNTFLGYASGYNNTGNFNIFLGYYSGYNNLVGERNTFLGYQSGYSNTDGERNTFLGFYSGYSNITGNYNTFIGYNSGYNNLGSGNVFLGYYAGHNETGSDKLYIDNTGTSSPLIWGDFSTNKLNFNGDVGIGTTDTFGYKLAVNGNIGAKEVKVEISSPWPDFVFSNNYVLPTLDEVETHIKANGHLKDIPSEAEVKENGINLGEMDAKLLRKIEELMLYTIQQQKEIETLKKENNTLKSLYKDLISLKAEVKKLKINHYENE